MAYFALNASCICGIKVDNLSTVVLFDIGNPYLFSKRLCILLAFNIKAGLDYSSMRRPFYCRSKSFHSFHCPSSLSVNTKMCSMWIMLSDSSYLCEFLAGKSNNDSKKWPQLWSKAFTSEAEVLDILLPQKPDPICAASYSSSSTAAWLVYVNGLSCSPVWG